jgi:hypothetical protein
MPATVIEGRDPLGYLAGIGLMAIAPGLRLRWSDGPYHYAEIDVDAEAIIADVVADAAAYAPAWMDGRADEIWPIDAIEVMRGDAEIDRAGVVPATPGGWACLWMLSGQQEPMRTGRTLRDLAGDPAIIREAIVGDGYRPIARPAARHTDLRLSHTSGRPTALRATRPTAAPDPVSAGLQWLAWRGVVALDWRQAAYLDLALWGDWRTAATRETLPCDRVLRCRISRDSYGYGTISPGEVLIIRRPDPPIDPLPAMADAQRRDRIVRAALAGDRDAMDVALDAGWLP